MVKEQKEIYILQEENEKGKNRQIAVIQLILAFGAVAGILLSLWELFYSYVDFVFSLLNCLVVLNLYQISFKKSKPYLRKKLSRLLYLIGIIEFVILVILGNDGLIDCVNRFISLINNRFDMEIEYYAVGNNVEIGSVLMWVFVSFALSYIIIRQIRKEKILISIALCMIALIFGFDIGKGNMLPAVVVQVAVIINLFIFYSAPKRTLNTKEHIHVIIFMAMFGVIIASASNYKALRQLSNVKYNVEQKIEEFRYGKDTLPHGDLKKATNLLEGDTTRLHIKAEHPEQMYLKGFVGSVYKGNKWEKVPQSSYENSYSGMLEWLGERKFDPLKQFDSYIKNSSSTVETSKVTVKNVDAYRKYIYTPATVSEIDSSSVREIKDYQFQTNKFFGTSDYSLSIVNDGPTADTAVEADWLTKGTNEKQNLYLSVESIYHGFVKDTYTNVGSNMKNFLNNIFFDKTDKNDFEEVTINIRRVLAENIDYTDSPKAVPNNRDSISWILKDYNRGNAVYFATVAVMAYRTAGYPARYVEGYCFTKNEAEDLKGKKEFDLTTKNAHAWVEVYVSGIGWLPIEVVPGMYDNNYTTSIIEGKASYEISKKNEESGIETVSGGVKDGENTKEKNKNKLSAKETIRNAFNIVLVFMYLMLIVYVILEIQRFIRKRIKRKYENSEQQHIEKIDKLFIVAGVSGEYIEPMALYEKLSQKYPEIEKDQYERVVLLVEKFRFGQKSLRDYELYVLECFENKLVKLLYEKSKIHKKLVLRYKYLL